MYPRTFLLAALCAAALALPSICTAQSGAAQSATAQTGARFSGLLVNSLSGDPIPAATVQLDELRREIQSAADGTFSFDNVPPGTYHLSIRAAG